MIQLNKWKEIQFKLKLTALKNKNAHNSMNQMKEV